MKRKILILGGNSDIGKALIDKLLKEKNFHLHVHFNKKKPKKINGIKYIKLDLNKANEKNIKKNLIKIMTLL